MPRHSVARDVVNGVSRVEVRCNVCDHQWKTTAIVPYCPKCHRGSGSVGKKVTDITWL